MITIIEFQCETCKRKYVTHEAAEECELQGKFKGDKYSAGLMFEYHHHGYVGIFAFPHIPKSYNDSHYGEAHYWACRQNNNDTIDEGQYCGSDFLYDNELKFKSWVKYHFISEERINGPEFKRMVKHLKAKNITPTYYTKTGKLITL